MYLLLERQGIKNCHKKSVMKGTCRTEVKQNEKKTRDTENTALCTDCGFYNGKRCSAASCRPSNQRTEGAEKQEALEALENRPTVAPTLAVSVTPSPTPRPTATPTPIPTVVAAFNPDDFWNEWYSTDGTVTMNIYNISLDTVSFSFLRRTAITPRQ